MLSPALRVLVSVALVSGALFALQPAARAATTIVVTPDGTAGSNGALGIGVLPAAGDGEASPDALASELGGDPNNRAITAAGTGGSGGTGGASTFDPSEPVSIGGAGGNGGAGGMAQSTAHAATAAGPADALAQAGGGFGGSGGAGGTGANAAGAQGAGGAGGTAVASTTAEASAGDATASASATGGGGGAGGTGGAGADASAIGEALAHGGNASSSVYALGGSSGNGGPVSGDTSWTHSGDAQATSSAVASGAGEAHAWAFAIGGRAPRVGDSVGTGGDATASASAVSDTGPATAEVLETGGSGAFGGGTIQIVLPAGAGRASLATDAVSGATAGLLTLRQTARGGDGGDGLKPGPGGAAESDLHATNPGGGALLAESIAIGGSAGSAGDDRGNPTTYLPDGAAALATVVATDQVGASVSALASAQGGTAGSSLFFGYHGLGGSATANALAIGLGEVTAAATALAPHGGATHATSEAQRSGPIAAARVDASLPVGDVARAYAPRRDLEARAGIATGAPSAAILADSAAATWTAAPNAGDAASWLSGNPNAAASGMDVLALGSLANRIQTGNPNLSGTLELDLTTADFAPGTRLALAFLDPSAVGLGLSFLHLSFSNDGAVSFETSFADTGSALAGLDDVVVDVGTLAATSDSLRRLVLSFELDLGDAGFGQEAGFAFDFALLASAAPAPEPGSLSLLGVAGAALLFAVRKAR